ncbi:cell envelope integrity protein TolA [Legionella impletisoli]|uniref:Protein TolA n=1 Tax=Legionella impletisoli TaxID=343510 RepID=A0A917JPK6_9GAMM|nr:cell envelope integrity protein TolA [Legionella impletisoli]GGI76963.1 protein TolA [Legionella impletisoli]
MIEQRSYRVAFACAIAIHLVVVILLLSNPSSERPTLMLSAKNESALAPKEPSLEEKAIKAASVDSQEVQETINKLKEERRQQKLSEERKQLALKKEAQEAKRQRLEEQKRVERLKEEAVKLAKEQQRKLAEEQNRLKQLAKQKEAEEKRLAEIKEKEVQLKKQQEAEAAKLAELKKKQVAQAKAEEERKRQLAAEQAAREAEKNARIAGEVDKYKALIINAISRQWILPDNVDSSLSSQFRIRLAPTGAVLEVSLIRSSGDPILDRSAQSAIYKASPLPVPSDPDAFNVFRDISLTVRPENARG